MVWDFTDSIETLRTRQAAGSVHTSFLSNPFHADLPYNRRRKRCALKLYELGCRRVRLRDDVISLILKFSIYVFIMKLLNNIVISLKSKVGYATVCVKT